MLYTLFSIPYSRFQFKLIVRVCFRSGPDLKQKHILPAHSLQLYKLIPYDPACAQETFERTRETKISSNRYTIQFPVFTPIEGTFVLLCIKVEHFGPCSLLKKRARGRGVPWSRATLNSGSAAQIVVVGSLAGSCARFLGPRPLDTHSHGQTTQYDRDRTKNEPKEAPAKNGRSREEKAGQAAGPEDLSPVGCLCSRLSDRIRARATGDCGL